MFQFKINEFSGPLDLLLHLIKSHDMDIINIQIEEITNQYLLYLKEMENLNLEIASEYLVMASELIELKSRVLLPREEKEEDIIEEDPRKELVKRLLEYEAYKEITKVLEEKEKDRSNVFTKLPEANKLYVEENNVSGEGDLNLLMEAFKRFLQRKEDAKPLKTKVTSREILVSTRRHEIASLLSRKKKVSFFELFPEKTKEYVVATFLAILEMAKAREVNITQEDTFDEIIVEEAS